MSWLQEYSLHRQDKLQPEHNLVRTPGHVLQELQYTHKKCKYSSQYQRITSLISNNNLLHKF